MYESFYGFREKPFSLLPDPEFLYLSAKHSAAYSVLDYGLTGQAGFTVISGEVGSGKTTLVRRFLRQVGDDTTVGLISNTPRDFGNLLRWILYAFDLDYQGKETVELHEAFTEFLIAQYAAGRRCVLIVDEAQNLAPETLEELRMLSNVNASKDLLLQVVLVGQPELAETLNRPDLHQFAQRVAISYHLKALTLQETHAYIRHRLTVAGGDADAFTDAACDALYFLSKGIPRVINGLCDIALVYGFGEEMRQIDVDTVISVIEDRGQSGQWMGKDPPSREQIHEEVRRLVAARRTKVAARSKRVVGRQSVGGDAPFAVVPSETTLDAGTLETLGTPARGSSVPLRQRRRGQCRRTRRRRMQSGRMARQTLSPSPLLHRSIRFRPIRQRGRGHGNSRRSFRVPGGSRPPNRLSIKGSCAGFLRPPRWRSFWSAYGWSWLRQDSICWSAGWARASRDSRERPSPRIPPHVVAERTSCPGLERIRRHKISRRPEGSSSRQETG